MNDVFGQISHLVCNNCGGLISSVPDPENRPMLVASGGICGPSCDCEPTTYELSPGAFIEVIDQ